MTAIDGIATLAREAPLVYVTLLFTAAIGVYVVSRILIEALVSLLRTFGIVIISIMERMSGQDKGRMDSWI